MAPHTPRLSKASAHAEVARRYRDQAKRRARHQSKPRTHASIRISELTRLFDDMWGRARIEDSDLGAAAARIMAHHIGHLRDGPRRISAWLERCAPWLDIASRERLMNEVHYCPLKWKADKLAWKLRVTDATRTRLKLTTIGAIDVPREERIKRRARMKRTKMQHRRRQDGVKPRGEYLKAVRSAKPWIEAGISRATWFRRHRET